MTPDEERLVEQLARALGPFAMQHSAALAYVGSGSTFGLGSATCVEIDSRFLLATAGHNLDRVPEGLELRIVPPDGSLDEAVPTLGHNATTERGEGSIDVAWIEIERSTAHAHGLAAIPLANLRPFHSGSEDHLYLVQGLPHTLAEMRRESGGKTLRLSSVSYLTTPFVPKLGQPSRIDIVVDYGTGTPSHHSPDLQMPQPGGISGGGVWLSGNPPGSTVWSPSRCLLVGVVRAYRKGSRRLTGVQVQHWLDLVGRDLPELNASIQAHLGLHRGAA